MGRLDGKVAIIFGASPNMGGTIAHWLAKEGAKIAACDLDPKVAQQTADFLNGRGYETIALSGDASEQDQVVRMVKDTVDHFGFVDTMVNLAGRQLRWPVTDINIHDWNLQIKTFLTAGMLTTKHVAKAMIEKDKKGCLIHILSSAAHYGEPGNSGYSASKAGLNYFSKAAAMDLAHLGIRVNCITPYAMEHNIWRFGVGAPFRTRYSTNMQDFLESIPMGRFPRASDIGNAAVFLADDASDYITGADIPVDGGTRAKYPGWQPGKFTNIDVKDYYEQNVATAFGEPVEKTV
ncbi:MAG: SDR family oxidoreductase [Chloroflexi bacterium]|nr:SDR family oxidoreductase [Chloroflexota bacterium]